MPYEGNYHIGPRQQISAIILGGMFVLLFLTMQTVTNTGVSRETSIFVVVPLALCQLYCITLLYLQTELFKKAAMEKEMNSLNMLYERQRQQYQVAKRNVQIINRKCHELKVQIADLRRMAPNAALQQSLNEAEAAARQYDASTQTGSEVLDVVLTEKMHAVRSPPHQHQQCSGRYLPALYGSGRSVRSVCQRTGSCH